MQEAVLLPLATWQNFYVIIGSAAATLTGLMFVVITLLAGVPGRRSSGALGVFTTPNVLHLLRQICDNCMIWLRHLPAIVDLYKDHLLCHEQR
jgi:hypothetical protein